MGVNDSTPTIACDRTAITPRPAGGTELVSEYFQFFIGGHDARLANPGATDPSGQGPSRDLSQRPYCFRGECTIMNRMVLSLTARPHAGQTPRCTVSWPRKGGVQPGKKL